MLRVGIALALWFTYLGISAAMFNSCELDVSNVSLIWAFLIVLQAFMSVEKRLRSHSDGRTASPPVPQPEHT
jgi:hypothetical protein